MQNGSEQKDLYRIGDLVRLKRSGIPVTAQAYFDIVPMEFIEDNDTFSAFTFLCHFKGTFGVKEYGFRKCYGRGCAHGRCTYIYDAAMAADHYLQKDFDRLNIAGINLQKPRLTLEYIVNRIKKDHLQQSPVHTIDNYLKDAQRGNRVSIDIDLDTVAAVEQSGSLSTQRVFLIASFTGTCFGKTDHFERCLACFTSDREIMEKKEKIILANERLNAFYATFDRVSIAYDKCYFQTP